MIEDTQQRFSDRYQAGDVPWDDELPPPEVQALVSSLSAGRALDLGCGYGRTAIYLARNGWQVDGVDFVAEAISEATNRAEKANLADRVRFHTASVTELGFLQTKYQLAIDVGCMHALDEQGRQLYWSELNRLLAPDAFYLLFARLTGSDEQADEGPRGVTETAVLEQFTNGFQLIKKEVGLTHMPDQSWGSGWFWFRKNQE